MSRYSGKHGVALHCATVTPSDSALNEFDALYIGTSGSLAIKDPAGTSVTFVSAPIGVLPVSCSLVLATGTTAANIVGLRLY